MAKRGARNPSARTTRATASANSGDKRPHSPDPLSPRKRQQTEEVISSDTSDLESELSLSPSKRVRTAKRPSSPETRVFPSRLELIVEATVCLEQLSLDQ